MPEFQLLSSVWTRAISNQSPFIDRESLLTAKDVPNHFFKKPMRTSHTILQPVSKVAFFTLIPHKLIYCLRTILKKKKDDEVVQRD